MENQCNCLDKVVGDILVAMIKNGDMDQEDATFERRLRHTIEASKGIFMEFNKIHKEFGIKE